MFTTKKVSLDYGVFCICFCIDYYGTFLCLSVGAVLFTGLGAVSCGYLDDIVIIMGGIMMLAKASL
jgi:hypothetical protein